MAGPVFLGGEVVDLRTIEHEDVAFMQRLVNDPAVRHSVQNVDPISEHQETDTVGRNFVNRFATPGWRNS